MHNSLRLQGMALLTGPNMAGKSTILRSTCAVALLGACGLYAPAQKARVPYFGEAGWLAGWLLRGGRGHQFGKIGGALLSVPASMAPASSADAFMLRNFSSDSPLEGRSSFAVEMTEMRCAALRPPPPVHCELSYLGGSSTFCLHACVPGVVADAGMCWRTSRRVPWCW